MAVFLELAAGTFAKDPAVAFSGTLYMVLAVIFGVLIYRKGLSLLWCTLIMLPIVIGAVFYGNASPWVGQLFSFGYDVATKEGQASLLDLWRIILIVYIFLASVLPVWLLLSPGLWPPICSTSPCHRRRGDDLRQSFEPARPSWDFPT